MQDISLVRGSRVKIFVGEFGSGKTEFAVNFALALKHQGYATAIVDIDLVKPYFRTRESRLLLEENGVKVVAPERKFTHSDLPVLPHELTRVLYEPDWQVVIDVGGGEAAVALGQLHQQLAASTYMAMMIVNTRRPFTSTPEEVVRALRRIELVSRLKIAGLVSNTNLAGETGVEHIMEGLAIVKQAAVILGLPINWVVIPHWLTGKVSVPYPTFVLKPYTQYPWI